MYWQGKNAYNIDVESLKKMYADGMTTNELAEHFNINNCTIASYLKRAGVVLRTNKEAQGLRARQGKSTRENHHHWNGGRKTDHGYISILMPDYPRSVKNGYVREHIYVWETTYGKPLPKGWVVHHYNGIRDDNRPENLFAMPNSDHSRKELGNEYKARIRELEQEVQELRSKLQQELPLAV